MYLKESCLLSSYNSVPKNDAHIFQYWSLERCLTIESPYPFITGDTIEILQVIPEEDKILIMPTKKEAKGVFTIVSNDIPLSAEDHYQFQCSNCEIIHLMQTIANGNKLYTIATAVYDSPARIKAYDRVNKSQLSFGIDCNG